MTTIASSPDLEVAAPARVRAADPLAWTLPTVLAASMSTLIGVIWDISWHQSIGRDSFLSPPHLAIYLGGVLAGLACGAAILHATFVKDSPARATSVRFWGFRGPIGAWVAVWGAIAMVTSAPFDNWWHDAYGIDVKIVSPPHVILGLGMMSIQAGAMLMLAAAQNRAAQGTRRPLALMYAASAGILLALMATMAQEDASLGNEMHSALFYRIAASVFPVILLAAARGARLAWPATTVALLYMGAQLLMVWILPLFPATPRLGPIYNTVTHFTAPPFPLLLVAPALVLDLLMRRLGPERDWQVALIGGPLFVLAMVAVQWPFAHFLLSPYARNAVFGADQWGYMVRRGPWLYEFWNLDTDAAGNWSPRLFGIGLAWAALYATVSARLGLWWGRWMREVVR